MVVWIEISAKYVFALPTLVTTCVVVWIEIGRYRTTRRRL